jgi:hypothetical protein
LIAAPAELQALIRPVAAENRLWGQKRIEAELPKLEFEVSASRGEAYGPHKVVCRIRSLSLLKNLSDFRIPNPAGYSDAKLITVANEWPALLA